MKSRYRAAVLVNREMLSLYFGIGEYIALNSRKGFWGTSAIEVISQQLQKELPGLRGFSASNMKNMRIFYEEWDTVINRQLPTADLQGDENKLNGNSFLSTNSMGIDENLLLDKIRQSATAEFDWDIFLRDTLQADGRCSLPHRTGSTAGIQGHFAGCRKIEKIAGGITEKESRDILINIA